MSPAVNGYWTQRFDVVLCRLFYRWKTLFIPNPMQIIVSSIYTGTESHSGNNKPLF